MRLALLTHEPFYPPSGGGSAEANYLVSELTRRDHEVHLFCPDFPDRDAIAARFGITVNAIAPGYIDTDMVAAVPEPVLEKIVAKIPVGRLGHANEIARGVSFLCSEDAGFVTGSTMSINGGQHMY